MQLDLFGAAPESKPTASTKKVEQPQQLDLFDQPGSPIPATSKFEGPAEQFVVKDGVVVGHNLKANWKELKAQHLTELPMFDTEIAHYILHPEMRHYLDYLLSIYGCKGVCELKQSLEEELQKEGLWSLFADIEMPLMPVLAEMEEAGVMIDTEGLKETSRLFTEQMLALEQEIHSLAGLNFNISSPKQVGEVLDFAAQRQAAMPAAFDPHAPLCVQDGEHEHAHEHGHEHAHHTLRDIHEIVATLDLPAKVKEDVCAVYASIAAAESQVHGKTVNEIHFHEVGTMDAVADITSVCILMDMIKPDKVVVSPIATGFGKVHCMHGILPVPAPATAFILKGVPTYSGRIEGELCTPTGAALIKTFADEFGNMPVMVTERIGYGMGKKDFEAANCVRVMLGEELKNNTCASNQNDVLTDPEFHVSAVDHADRICTLECNIDDMTGEEIGFATDELMKCGARDVFTIPINMKKGRPGILLSVICSMEDKEKMVRDIFRLTSTIGIRQKICERYVLDRKIEKKNTPYGEVSIKRVSGYGVERSKVEYEDLNRIAEAEGISVSDARKLIEECEDD